MNSKLWFRVAMFLSFIALMFWAFKFYGDYKEGHFQTERVTLVKEVSASQTEAQKAKTLQKEAEIRTEIVREASADYEAKLKAHFEESHRKTKEEFILQAKTMRENYEAEMAKFKLKTTVSVGGNQSVTVVLQDTTNAKSVREYKESVGRVFTWNDEYLTAKVFVKGDSATIVDYSYTSDLIFKKRFVAGSLTRVPYQVIEIAPKNPNGVLRAEDRTLIVPQRPTPLQKMFGNQTKKPLPK